MGGGDLNMKKSWHPVLLVNQEKVWKAEKAVNEERKKLAQLRKEQEEERQLAELQRLQEAATGKKRVEKLDWMYAAPGGEGGALGGARIGEREMEDYLLGKKRVDDVLRAGEKNIGNSHREFIAVQNANSARDTAAKIRLDPLLEMKQKQLAYVESLKNQPEIRRKLKEMQKAKEGKEGESKDERRARRKSEKEERRRDRHSRRDRDRNRDSRSPRSDYSDDDRDRKSSRRRDSFNDREDRDRRYRDRSRSSSPRRRRDDSPRRRRDDEDRRHRDRDDDDRRRYRDDSPRRSSGGRDRSRDVKSERSHRDDREDRGSGRDRYESRDRQEDRVPPPRHRDSVDVKPDVKPDGRAEYRPHPSRPSAMEMGDRPTQPSGPPPPRHMYGGSATGHSQSNGPPPPRHMYGGPTEGNTRSNGPPAASAQPPPPAPAAGGGSGNHLDAMRAARLAAMSQSATDLHQQRSKALAQRAEQEKLEDEREERMRKKWGKDDVKAGFYGQKSDMGLSDVLARRAGQGLQRDI